MQEIDYRAGEMFNLKTYTQDMGKFAKWWHDLTTKKDSYLNDSFVTDVKKIEVIDNPSFYANISDNSFKQYGDELYINECDMAAFKSFGVNLKLSSACKFIGTTFPPHICASGP